MTKKNPARTSTKSGRKPDTTYRNKNTGRFVTHTTKTHPSEDSATHRGDKTSAIDWVWRGESAEKKLMSTVTSFAEVIRLVPHSHAAESTRPVNDDVFFITLKALAKYGILKNGIEAGEVGAGQALEAIRESPVPELEWRIYEILGKQLADLTGISPTSMNRYRAGERETPDDVGLRLHVITQIISDLAGSYNDYGIRRWFDRPRSVLEGSSPAEILQGQWDPDSPEVNKVRELAAALLA